MGENESTVVRKTKVEAGPRSVDSKGSSAGRGKARGQQRLASGKALVIVVAVVVAVGLIIGALTAWELHDKRNGLPPRSSTALDNAISGVMGVAIQSIRYVPLVSQTSPGPGYCWKPPDGGLISDLVGRRAIDGVSVAVWCSTSENLASTKTRTVTFRACQVLVSLQRTGSKGATEASKNEFACEHHPLLTAVVIFDDYPARRHKSLTSTCSATARPARKCGYKATEVKWIWSS
jgi:hypothetical protein